MKRTLSLLFLSLVVMLGLSLTAVADEFSYTYTGDGFTAMGTLNGTPISPGTPYALSTGGITTPTDAFDITSGTINLTGSLTGSGTLYANPNTTSYSTSPDGLFWYDDLLYLSSNPQLDIDGLLFEVSGSVVSLNIWGNAPAPNYSLYEGQNGGYPYQYANGSFTATVTPEPASILLATAFFLAAGLFHRRLLVG
ncbi:MAG TPA: hypothetical protein VKO18_08920 [Terriglobia bacterium]|nr:hypothetical protein [Terriglobia bacterium]